MLFKNQKYMRINRKILWIKFTQHEVVNNFVRYIYIHVYIYIYRLCLCFEFHIFVCICYAKVCQVADLLCADKFCSVMNFFCVFDQLLEMCCLRCFAWEMLLERCCLRGVAWEVLLERLVNNPTNLDCWTSSEINYSILFCISLKRLAP